MYAGNGEKLFLPSQGPSPYEHRVFPLNDAELMVITRETEDCDIGPPSPPIDTSANDANNYEEVGTTSHWQAGLQNLLLFTLI